MKIVLIFLFLTLPILSFSQRVNNVSFKEIDAEYIEFYVLGKLFKGPKYYLYVDYGQQRSVGKIRPEELLVKDDLGIEIPFNSDVECLNFMVKNGYELVLKNERVSEGNSYPVFLMRKIKKREEEKKQ
jgi:hypothetical protein